MDRVVQSDHDLAPFGISNNLFYFRNWDRLLVVNLAVKFVSYF